MSCCRTKKQTFIIAALVIFLCLVSISGATYALFTSNIADGTIGINATSGNLEVDIIDTALQNPDSLVGEVLKFVTPAGNTEDVLFEPGATYYTEGFRVRNSGDIPINYILYISEDEVRGTDFADAFEVWITKNPSSADEDKMGLPKFSGSLAPKQDSDIYYLVVRMKTTAGNEFQNRAYSGIGITVCAVQGNVKFD